MMIDSEDKRLRKQARQRQKTYLGLLFVVGIYLTLLWNANPSDEPQDRRQLSHKKTRTLPEDGDFSKYSCEDLYTYTNGDREAQCDFARTCNDGDGIFVPQVWCSERYSTRSLILMLSAPLGFLLVVLFRILGSTAEEFFSPGLEMLSIKLHVPERFAGVTLLALGNGAPDVASTVSALLHDRKRGYLLALGELTGASMVASTLIVGAVTFYSADPVVCQGALVRDVVMFMITLVAVFFSFNDGTIDSREVHLFFGLYFGYVLLVLVSDIYQRRAALHARLRKSTGADIEKEPDEMTALRTVAPDRQRGMSVGSYELSNQTKKEPFWQRALSWDTAESRPSIMHRMIQSLSNYNEQSLDEENGEDVEQQQEMWGELEDDGTEPLMVFHPHHGGIVDLKLSTRLVPSGGPSTITEAGMVGQELADYFVSFWNETVRSSEYNVVEKFLMLCELPITILRLFTIPVPCDGYYCRPLLALSIALCPVWLWYYLKAQFDVGMDDKSPVVIFISFAVPVFLGALVLRFAPCGDIPPRLSAAVPITMLGFVVSATWLDYIADKIVSMLEFFGIACGIPSTIMGLTILAWGNSTQDLVANMTVARKGLSTMAITASFAGPVFNMLVGLGMGLAFLQAENPSKKIVVHLNNTLRVGFLFSILTGVLVIGSGVCIGKGTIPKKYGLVAGFVYLVYVVASLVF